MENLFKALEEEEINIKIVIDDLVIGVKTLLNIITIASQNGRESN